MTNEHEQCYSDPKALEEQNHSSVASEVGAGAKLTETTPFLPLFRRKDVKSKRALLTPETPYVHFNLHLTLAEQSAWAELKVEKDLPQLDLYGNLKGLIALVRKYLQDAGNRHSISDTVAQSVDSIVNELVSQFDAQTAWVCMRVSLKNNRYDIPRWHTDGHYMGPPEGEKHKVVMALKGRHTLFYNLPSQLREQFMALQEANVDSDDTTHRLKIAQLIDKAKIDSPTPPVGTIFIAGADHSAVHSEPPIDSDRVFLSIFPCSFEQAEEKKNADERSLLNFRKDTCLKSMALGAVALTFGFIAYQLASRSFNRSVNSRIDIGTKIR